MLRLLENTEVPPVAVRRPTNLRDLRRQVHARLIDSLDGESADALDRPEVVSERIGEILWDLSRETELTVSLPERRRIESEILDDLKGMGPLASLMLDRGITDILVNGPDEVWIDRCGQLERTDLAFDDDAHLRRFIDRLVAGQGRHLDARHPQVDARLPDGSRLHGGQLHHGLPVPHEVQVQGGAPSLSLLPQRRSSSSSSSTSSSSISSSSSRPSRCRSTRHLRHRQQPRTRL